MKKNILWGIYSVFALLALAGIVSLAVLYPTHAAHGTSAGYFTLLLFPVIFLLTGLSGIRFRYWWVPAAALLLGLAVYLLSFPEVFPILFLYICLAAGSGISGQSLRREIQFSRK